MDAALARFRERRSRFAENKKAFSDFVFGAPSDPLIEGRLDLNIELDDDGQLIGESGALADFSNALLARESEYQSFDAREFVGELVEAAEFKSIGVADIHRLSAESKAIAGATDSDGRSVSQEIIRKGLEDIGFNGTIGSPTSEDTPT